MYKLSESYALRRLFALWCHGLTKSEYKTIFVTTSPQKSRENIRLGFPSVGKDNFLCGFPLNDFFLSLSLSSAIPLVRNIDDLRAAGFSLVSYRSFYIKWKNQKQKTISFQS